MCKSFTYLKESHMKCALPFHSEKSFLKNSHVLLASGKRWFAFSFPRFCSFLTVDNIKPLKNKSIFIISSKFCFIWHWLTNIFLTEYAVRMWTRCKNFTWNHCCCSSIIHSSNYTVSVNQRQQYSKTSYTISTITKRRQLTKPGTTTPPVRLCFALHLYQYHNWCWCVCMCSFS